MTRVVLDRVAWPVGLGVSIVLSTYWIAGFYVLSGTERLFLDAHIYFRATEAWVSGGNPWLATYQGVPFAGIPPTLLLNLPLLPFGETLATAFWVVANTASVGYLVYSQRLPKWMFLCLPVAEGWLGASPDLSLAALAVTRASSIAVLTKPYSAPAVLACRGMRPIVWAGGLGLATLLIVPWQLFWESRGLVANAFEQFAGYPPSAAGALPLVALAIIALYLLGRRTGLGLATPALVSQQPHYTVFSLPWVAESRILSIAINVPLAHATAVGVVLYAAARFLRGRHGRKSARGLLRRA